MSYNLSCADAEIFVVVRRFSMFLYGFDVIDLSSSMNNPVTNWTGHRIEERSILNDASFNYLCILRCFSKRRRFGAFL